MRGIHYKGAETMNELVQMLAYTFAVISAAVFVCWWKGDKK